jgi:hypothetical protein
VAGLAALVDQFAFVIALGFAHLQDSVSFSQSHTLEDTDSFDNLALTSGVFWILILDLPLDSNISHPRYGDDRSMSRAYTKKRPIRAESVSHTRD